ncbi:MAG: acyl-ACP--UDP-N-acetylglucosamine O-acyltransferase [candidate division WOR-3 bacterium]|nr:acyl-ACP--UDP-N-acetylglucosamine O-acyltransferase [candidate division WOR-3 bacterium]
MSRSIFSSKILKHHIESTNLKASNLISPKATIAKDCKISPYVVIKDNVAVGKGCIIKPYVIVMDNTQIGEGCIINSFSVIMNNAQIGKKCKISPYTIIRDNVKIGNNCIIGSGTVIGSEPFDVNYYGEPSYVEIGDNNTIREFVTISRATGKYNKTLIGNNNLLGAYVHIGHNVIIKNNTVITNFTQIGGYCEIDDYANIGGMSGIHQFCRVGKYAMVGACSYLTKDLPPYLIGQGNPFKVLGVNTVGLKRNRFSSKQISNIKKAYKIIYRSQYCLSDAIKIIKDTLPPEEIIKILLDFIRMSKRGIALKEETLRKTDGTKHD